MKKVVTNKISRRIAALMIGLLVGVIVEIGCNSHSLYNNIGVMDITDSLKREEIDEKEKAENEKLMFLYEQKAPFYLKQVELQGIVKKDTGYTIQVTLLNEFGREETKTYSDTAYTWFTRYATDINERVTSVQISFTDSEDTDITNVLLSNTFEWNKYRMLFVLSIVILLYCAFFEPVFRNHPEYYFAIGAFLLGSVMILSSQIIYTSWDEQIHFRNTYCISQGRNVEWNEALMAFVEKTIPTCNTKLEYAELRACMNEKAKEYIYTEHNLQSPLTYTTLAYLPMALILKLGELAGLSFSITFMIGKCCNLLLYIAFMFYAIRIAKIKKPLLVFIALMPTVIFQAASYSYDIAVFECITLGSVLWLNENVRDSREYNLKSIIAIILLFSVGCFSKAVYIPMVLLALVLPGIMKKSTKERTIIWIGIVIIFLLVAATFVLPTLANTVAKNLEYGGDSRGGDTGSVRQMISMIKHPWASIKLMVKNIMCLDNFRNMGSAYTDNYFVGNLMFLNIGRLGVLRDRWSMLLIPILVILTLNKDDDEMADDLSRVNRLCAVCAVLLVVLLIWLALYLSFTPVGDEMIAGVQARYYLPIIYLLLAIIPTKKTGFSISKNSLFRAECVCIIVFWIAIAVDSLSVVI